MKDFIEIIVFSIWDMVWGVVGFEYLVIREEYFI